MSYRYLVIPDATAEDMSPEVLDKIRALIEGGVTVVGQRPRRSLGLVDHPASQQHVTRVAALLWGSGENRKQIRHLGKGRIVQDTALEQVIAADGLQPDLELREVTNALEIDWIHRQADDLDIYFVANLRRGVGPGRSGLSGIGQGAGALGPCQRRDARATRVSSGGGSNRRAA